MAISSVNNSDQYLNSDQLANTESYVHAGDPQRVKILGSSLAKTIFSFLDTIKVTIECVAILQISEPNES